MDKQEREREVAKERMRELARARALWGSALLVQEDISLLAGDDPTNDYGGADNLKLARASVAVYVGRLRAHVKRLEKKAAGRKGVGT